MHQLNDTVPQPILSPLSPLRAPAPLKIGIVGLGFGQYILNLLSHEPANRHFATAAVCARRRPQAQSRPEDAAAAATPSVTASAPQSPAPFR